MPRNSQRNSKITENQLLPVQSYHQEWQQMQSYHQELHQNASGEPTTVCNELSISKTSTSRGNLP